MTAAGYDLIIYTDGGCRGNPGPGGWGFLIFNPASGNALKRCGGERETTNNRMEMGAAIEALRALKKDGLRIKLHTDSQYLIKSMTEWIAGWKARGWKKKEGELKNVDLLQELDRLNQRHRITWQWVKGHAGDPGNECADALTNRAMDAVQAGKDPAWETRGTWPEH
jgi:ribonuclease HI